MRWFWFVSSPELVENLRAPDYLLSFLWLYHWFFLCFLRRFVTLFLLFSRLSCYLFIIARWIHSLWPFTCARDCTFILAISHFRVHTRFSLIRMFLFRLERLLRQRSYRYSRQSAILKQKLGLPGFKTLLWRRKSWHVRLSIELCCITGLFRRHNILARTIIRYMIVVVDASYRRMIVIIRHILSPACVLYIMVSRSVILCFLVRILVIVRVSTATRTTVDATAAAYAQKCDN